MRHSAVAHCPSRQEVSAPRPTHRPPDLRSRNSTGLARWPTLATLAGVLGALLIPTSEAAPALASNPPTLASTTSSAPVAPYAQSHVILGMNWDLSTVTSLRKANGSDLWPMTWGSDGNLYGAWGDGGGFNGDSNTTGRVSLGFARISGVPVDGSMSSYSGTNIWGAAPTYAQYPATFGGKVDDLISIQGVLYAHGGLWTASNCGCSDPIHKSGDNPTVRTLTWSADLGRSWQIAPWTTAQDWGASLQYGQDYSGAWDPTHVYLYVQGDRNSDPQHLYLRRVALANITANPATAGHYEYWSGVDSAGTPQWSTNSGTAEPIFSDSNVAPGTYANAAVVYDAPLGRYLLTTYHGNGTGQVGFFEAPSPWGPWATIAYYVDWGSFTESAGAANGLSFPSKWISADGKSLWGVFSGVNAFDAFNLAGLQLGTAAGIPQFVAPALGTMLTAGETVNARGAGTSLTWSVSLLKEGGPPIAHGTGTALSFVVPSNLAINEMVRITLTGTASSLYRDFPSAPASPLPTVTLQSTSSGQVDALSTASIGALAYTDRTYTLTQLTAPLVGARLILGANADKFVTSASYLTFHIDRAAQVYVCYSEQASRLPGWLTDGSWTLTSEKCEVGDARFVYRKSFAAGNVTLGGNRAPPATGSTDYSNYIVIVAR